MFDRVAPRYDLVNSVLSFGSDAAWRRRAARATRLQPGGSALDIACGTGLLAAELHLLAGSQGRVVGLDFSASMVEIARSSAAGSSYLRGDALRLPFPDGTFQASTMAFGLRNLADPVLGLREMLRVLVPGGRAVVLEFVRPAAGPLGSAYRLYLRSLLPLIGGLLSGERAAYRYLSDTVDSYRTPAQLLELAERAGWSGANLTTLTLGTVGLLTGSRQQAHGQP
jgi:demethylmenaquinone methyltransferase/2-methoxy-6-polyprenyl-1,4-benzoquinol methylase